MESGKRKCHWIDKRKTEQVVKREVGFMTLERYPSDISLFIWQAGVRLGSCHILQLIVEFRKLQASVSYKNKLLV